MFKKMLHNTAGNSVSKDYPVSSASPAHAATATATSATHAPSSSVPATSSPPLALARTSKTRTRSSGSHGSADGGEGDAKCDVPLVERTRAELLQVCEEQQRHLSQYTGKFSKLVRSYKATVAENKKLEAALESTQDLSTRRVKEAHEEMKLTTAAKAELAKEFEQRVEEQRSMAKAEMDVVRRKCHHLEDKLISVKAGHVKELDALQDKLRASRGNAPPRVDDGHRVEVATLVQRVEEGAREVQRCGARATQAEAALAALEAKHAAALGAHKQQTKKANAQDEKRALLGARVGDLEQALADSRVALQRETDAKAALQTVVEMLRKGEAEAQAGLEGGQKRAALLEIANKDLQAKVESVEARVLEARRAGEGPGLADEQSVRDHETDLQRMKSTIGQLVEENTELRGAADTARRRLHELEAEAATAHAATARCEAACADMREQLRAGAGAAVQLQEQVEALAEQAAARQTRLDEGDAARVAVAEAHAREVAALQEAVKQATADATPEGQSQSEVVATVEAELARQKEKCEGLQRTMARNTREAEDKLRRQALELERNASENSSLQSEMQLLNESVRRKNKEATAHRASQVAVAAEHERLHEQSKSERAHFHKERAALNRDLARTAKQVQEYKEEVEGLHKEARARRDEQTGMIDQLASAHTKKQALQRDLERATKREEEAVAVARGAMKKGEQVQSLQEALEAADKLNREREISFRRFETEAALKAADVTEMEEGTGRLKRQMQDLQLRLQASTTEAEADARLAAELKQSLATQREDHAKASNIHAQSHKQAQKLIAELKRSLHKELASQKAARRGSSSPRVRTTGAAENGSSHGASTGASTAAGSPVVGNGGPGTGGMATVNLDYINQVVFKYMVQPTKEKRHLVKAITTLLHFTPEQQLQLQHLESNTSLLATMGWG